jgi:hypothetical protein
MIRAAPILKPILPTALFTPAEPHRLISEALGRALVCSPFVVDEVEALDLVFT